MSKQFVKSYSEIHLEYVRKRKLDLEVELEILSEVEKKLFVKKPRRDLNIDRPARTVSPVPDKVWQTAMAGMSELFQQVNSTSSSTTTTRTTTTSVPPVDDDLFEQAEEAIDNAMASAVRQQQSIPLLPNPYPPTQFVFPMNNQVIGNIVPPQMRPATTRTVVHVASLDNDPDWLPKTPASRGRKAGKRA